MRTQHAAPLRVSEMMLFPRALLRWFAPALLLVLTLCGLWFGQRAARPELHYRLGFDDDRRTLVRFHDLERNERGFYAWSKPLAAIFAYGFDGRPALAELRLAAPREAGLPPAQLELGAGSIPLGHFPVDGGWRRYRLLTPTNPAGDTALTLTTTAYTPGERDSRELGVALSELRLRTVGQAPLLPAAPRSLSLLALPLLGWLLVVRLGGGRLPAVAAGLVLAGAASWAAAQPQQGSYLLPTIAWPWFPLLPLALLAALPTLQTGLGSLQARLAGRSEPAWLGLGLAILALFAIRAGLPAVPAMLLASGGALLATLALQEVPADPQSHLRAQERAGAPQRGELLILLAIVGLALFVRLINLDGQPAGLWRDESRHGLQALRIWQEPGYRPIYVVEGADLPAMLFYLMAPVVGLLGPAP